MSEEQSKPVLDEQTLAKILEAAYVLQEHNRELRELEHSLELKRDQIEAEDSPASLPTHKIERAPASESGDEGGYAPTLLQIVETQHQIQQRHLNLESAMSLIADRVIDILGAAGGAIGIVSGNTVRYRAAAGFRALSAGTEVPLNRALCVSTIRTGNVLCCPEINAQFLLDADECRRRGIKSLVVVPVFHDGGISGALEVYYSDPHAFSEDDVHTCQLMAGLVTEALAREEEAVNQKPSVDERAAIVEVLEKLKPNLMALAEKPVARDAPLPRATSASTVPCRKCGHKFVGEEQFCGQCGLPRASDYEPPSMQSKVASLWHMQEARKKGTQADVGGPGISLTQESTGRDHFEKPRIASGEEFVPDLLAETEMPVFKTEHVEELPTAITMRAEGSAKHDLELSTQTIAHEVVPESETVSASASAPAPPADWSSAASVRKFLEQMATKKRPGSLLQFWNTRRGDIYLGIAIILVLCVIRWAIWSNHSVATPAPPPAQTAASRPKPSPTADLSLFERMLINLGLADAPEVPVDKGNPAVQVWVDLHTALYYCPGAELYGKTPRGKFTTQREAQLDQFEPAYRKACN